MFAYEWGTKTKVKKEKRFNDIKKVSSMVWAEHCIECAVPQCFRTCAKYRKRKDGKCRLFKDGINKIAGDGLGGYSAKITFEGWSKLEATLRPKQHSKFTIKFFESLASFIMGFSKVLSLIFERKRKIWSITSFAYKIREFISLILNKSGSNPDCFLIDVYNPSEPVNLIIETKDIDNTFYYKESYELSNGHNTITIPAENIKYNAQKKSFISITLSDSHTLIFNALDFVTYNKEKTKKIDVDIKHKKIKCVAWDLDNTIWDGVLIEGKVRLNKKIVNRIKELDKKGIVNSIISKNDLAEAKAKLEKLGLFDYFVMPQINWNPKSYNLQQLAKNMNIGLDTICFVDDNPFEIEEVKHGCPDVLCINVKDIAYMDVLDCFNVEITSESSKRRQTYKMLELEHSEMEKWDGSIDDFLKQCNITIEVKRPAPEELPRCHELLQRTNQLNASGRRLSDEELLTIFNSNDYLCYRIKCKDKFGEYGIVGFSIYDITENTITDFVISCRVANKTIEQTFIREIAKNVSATNSVRMRYLKTNKNGPLFNVIMDMNMELIECSDDGVEIYQFDLENAAKKYDIVKIDFIK